jgi:hypothetical protein
VGLNGTVSERALQALLLPHPAAAGLQVKQSFDMFDDFIHEYGQRLPPATATGKHMQTC